MLRSEYIRGKDWPKYNPTLAKVERIILYFFIISPHICCVRRGYAAHSSLYIYDIYKDRIVLALFSKRLKGLSIKKH